MIGPGSSEKPTRNPPNLPTVHQVRLRECATRRPDRSSVIAPASGWRFASTPGPLGVRRPPHAGPPRAVRRVPGLRRRGRRGHVRPPRGVARDAGAPDQRPGAAALGATRRLSLVAAAAIVLVAAGLGGLYGTFGSSPPRAAPRSRCTRRWRAPRRTRSQPAPTLAAAIRLEEHRRREIGPARHRVAPQQNAHPSSHPLGGHPGFQSPPFSRHGRSRRARGRRRPGRPPAGRPRRPRTPASGACSRSRRSPRRRPPSRRRCSSSSAGRPPRRRRRPRLGPEGPVRGGVHRHRRQRLPLPEQPAQPEQHAVGRRDDVPRPVRRARHHVRRDSPSVGRRTSSMR